VNFHERLVGKSSQDMHPTLPSKLEPATHSEESNLNKIVSSRIEEVRRSAAQNCPSVNASKRPLLLHLDAPTMMSIPSLTTSREISQYGAFKKSIASVSTNNQSIRLPIRR